MDPTFTVVLNTEGHVNMQSDENCAKVLRGIVDGTPYTAMDVFGPTVEFISGPDEDFLLVLVDGDASGNIGDTLSVRAVWRQGTRLALEPVGARA